ncbi:hypothetical protein HMI56_004828 [Coelomomyces lativittatus]|nr:hypothetical protein HMI56_004828 [Coelomomyces lativittatus]
MSFLHKFYLLPEGHFLQVWEHFMVIIHVINGILIPLVLAFNDKYIYFFIIQFALDAFYVVDIFLKFHKAYLECGFYVVFPKEMAWRYLNSWESKFDFLVNLPLDLFALTEKENQLNLLSYLRLLKVLRTSKLILWFDKEENKLKATAQLKMGKFSIYIILLTHWCACIWYFIACDGSTCAPSSWAVKWYTGEELRSPSTMYIGALYWTVMTMTTTGYGDIHAVNEKEQLFSIFCMIMGVFLYGYIGGTISSTLSNADSRRVNYAQKVNAIKQYMKNLSLSLETQTKVLDWYEYIWVRNKGIDVVNVFNDLPTTFRAEVALIMNESILEKAPMFKERSIGFKRMLVLAMRITFFTSNTFVRHRGEKEREMFFVVQGRVDLLDNDDKTSIASMVEGSHFGELSLILGYPCESSAFAVCNSDIYVLRESDFLAACEAYPEDGVKARELTLESHQKNSQRKMKKKKKNPSQELEEAFSTKQGKSQEILNIDLSKTVKGSLGYLVLEEDQHSLLELAKDERRRKSLSSGHSSYVTEKREAPLLDVDIIIPVGRAMQSSQISPVGVENVCEIKELAEDLELENERKEVIPDVINSIKALPEITRSIADLEVPKESI